MKIYPITIDTIKKYLNIAVDNNQFDEVLIMLIASSYLQAQRITGLVLSKDETDDETELESNALIDLAVAKDIATNFQSRENFKDTENGNPIALSNSTLNILTQYRKQIIF
ncbi:phage gp6-like head-tail connector protein [bacterium]|nr:MAG: phage gp6-like head-tail connector protein [bacterium]